MQDNATPAELKSKFGDNADLYAEVRSETAAAAGRSKAAQKWRQTAEQVKDDDDDGGSARE
jgi:hypothetical protein